MNRNQKIEILKGIASGKKSIAELHEDAINLWFVKDGLYENGSLKLTEQEYEAHLKTLHPRTKNLVFMPARGCEPIIDED